MKSRGPRNDARGSFRWRAHLLLGLLGAAALGLVYRAVHLQLVDHGFLAKEGDARFSRVLDIAAHRGTITDRYGEPLAVSTPVDSIWVNPGELALATDQIPRLAAALNLDRQELARRITSNLDREFLYLARHLQPSEAEQIKALGIPGVYTSREYRRYYPAGEVTGHMLGFTNVDDAGQEGLELAFDHWLAGEDGAKRVIQDRYGRIVQNVESIRPARPGRDLVLSIDLRIQYLAYRELKAAIRDQRARAGSIVVLDVDTGEVLAMVNQPAYNPNDRDQIDAPPTATAPRPTSSSPAPPSSRSSSPPDLPRASTTTTASSTPRPASSKSGQDLRGRAQPRRHRHRHRPRQELQRRHGAPGARAAAAGDLDHAQPLRLRPGDHQRLPRRSAGLLPNYAQWRPIGIVTMSHGYGLSVTPLQLAHAYATIGGFGVVRPVSFLRVEGPPQRRARARRARVPRARRHARVGRCRRGHRQACRDPRLPGLGQDRHGLQGDRRWLLHRSLHGGVRRGGPHQCSRGLPRWS